MPERVRAKFLLNKSTVRKVDSLHFQLSSEERESEQKRTCLKASPHDPVNLLRATAHSKKAVKEKETASVAVSYCKIAIGYDPVVLAG